jgi:hypothetical protein
LEKIGKIRIKHRGVGDDERHAAIPFEWLNAAPTSDANGLGSPCDRQIV